MKALIVTLTIFELLLAARAEHPASAAASTSASAPAQTNALLGKVRLSAPNQAPQRPLAAPRASNPAAARARFQIQQDKLKLDADTANAGVSSGQIAVDRAQLETDKRSLNDALHRP